MNILGKYFSKFSTRALHAFAEGLTGVDTQKFPGTTPHTRHFSGAGSAGEPRGNSLIGKAYETFSEQKDSYGFLMDFA